MSVNEDVLRRLVIELQILQETADNIQSRIGMTNAAINELQIAHNTLEGIKKEKNGSSLLMPIGGGSYIKSKLEDSKKLIVGIGANVAVEKNIGEAQEAFQTRLLRLDKVRGSLQQQLEEIATKITNTRTQFQTLSEQLQEGKRNV
jgi:prefoldin alpha subunit